LQKLQEVETIN